MAAEPPPMCPPKNHWAICPPVPPPILNRLFNRLLPAPILSDAAAARLIADSISAARPFLASRIGWVEASAIYQGWLRRRPSPELRRKLWKHAGVFPDTLEAFQKFCEIYFAATRSIDLLGIMDGEPFQKKILRASGARPALCRLSALEPYLLAEPWSASLANKRVTVVHPFDTSIKKQFARRVEIFRDPRVLPPFELRIIRPPVSLAFGHGPPGLGNWADALDHLTERVLSEPFDVAILGCGAYGLPLGQRIRSAGFPAIHIGGATQILFGIWGARWRGNPQFQALATPAWTSPDPSEKPPGADAIEGGCYW